MPQTGWFSRWPLVLAVTLVLAGAAQAQVVAKAAASKPSAGPTAETPSRPDLTGRRIVKHFDFNERPFGNFDTIPMYWARHVDQGFPEFLEGSFDHEVGQASAPSFRFELNGGSLGYHYQGQDIAVRTNSDYLIVAWVKTESLATARAYLTAYYLDRKGVRIAGTDQRSQLVGGTDGSTEWQPVTVALPGNVPQARYVGLSLWLTQAGVWFTGPKPMRAIESEDVRARVWFDDITVYRLPRVTLQTASPGNVFDEDERVELRSEVNDPDGLNLSATLVVRSADGRTVDERAVPVHSRESAEYDRIVYDHLEVGLYHAELIVRTEETLLVRRELRFARLASRVSAPADTGRGFGVVLNDIDPGLLVGQRGLLRQLRPELVKTPVWYAQRAATELNSANDDVDRYLEAIVEAHADPIGILMDDPSNGSNQANAGLHSMIEILSEDPLGWKPLIAGVWSRYAGLIQVWQVGGDGDEFVFLDHRLGELIPVLRREMKPLMSEPLLATTSSLHHSLPPERLGDYRSVSLPATVSPDEIPGHVQPLLGGDPQRVWLTVQPLPDGPYPRGLRLADLSRRLVEAFYQNVAAVFVDAPWDAHPDLIAPTVNPREEFIVLRTVADILGGSEPVSRTSIDGEARCIVFDRNRRAILFVWDDYAPPEGREHILLLGEDAQQVDLWGRRSTLPCVGDKQVVRIGPTPTFIVNTSTWLIEFGRHFRLEPVLVEASIEANETQVIFRNTYHEAVSGVVRLFPPENWDLQPNRIPFALQPGEEFKQAISIRFPQNAEAGLKALVGEFSIDATQRYQIIIPAWFELGLKDIDLDTYVFRTGNRVVVRQSLTNRTKEPVSFDGYVIAPRRQRMNRLFASCMPCQSITKDFVLDAAADLAGRKIRVGVKEVQGARVWNQVINVP